MKNAKIQVILDRIYIEQKRSEERQYLKIIIQENNTNVKWCWKSDYLPSSKEVNLEEN